MAVVSILQGSNTSEYEDYDKKWTDRCNALFPKTGDAVDMLRDDDVIAAKATREIFVCLFSKILPPNE